MEEGGVPVPLIKPIHTRPLPSHNFFTLKQFTQLAFSSTSSLVISLGSGLETKSFQFAFKLADLLTYIAKLLTSPNMEFGGNDLQAVPS